MLPLAYGRECKPMQIYACLDWPRGTHCESSIQKMIQLAGQKLSDVSE